MPSSKSLNVAEQKMLDAYRAKHLAAYSCEVGKKRCSQCKKVDVPEAFTARCSWCKACTQVRMHKYYEAAKLVKKKAAEQASQKKTTTKKLKKTNA
jgi:ribosomal protein S21